MEKTNKRKQTNGGAKSLLAIIAVIALVVSIVCASPAFSAASERGKLQMARDAAKERYGEVLGRYRESAGEYRNAREEFFQVREEYLKARRLGGGPRTNASEGDVLLSAKGYMISSADNLIALIDHVESEVLTIAPFATDETFDANYTERLENLQEGWLDELGNARSNVTALIEKINASETEQELVLVAREMNSIWKDVRKLAQRVYYLARVEKGYAIHNRIRSVEKRIEDFSANLTNSEEIASILGDVEGALGASREKFAGARIAFASGDNAQGKRLMKESQDSLKDAMGFVRQAFTAYRNSTRNGEVSEEEDN